MDISAYSNGHKMFGSTMCPAHMYTTLLSHHSKYPTSGKEENKKVFFTKAKTNLKRYINSIIPRIQFNLNLFKI